MGAKQISFKSHLNSILKIKIVKNIKLALALLLANQISAQLPDPGFNVDSRTAIVITDLKTISLVQKVQPGA
jgi:hypothetical protein